jgi:hypothetical protein
MAFARALFVPVLLAALAGGGCRVGKPVYSSTPENQRTPGTIAGIVSDGGAPVAGRRVHAVADATSQRYTAVTAQNGGFTIPVPPGKYRLQVELVEGERVVRDPGLIDINESDLDANLQVVIGVR